ncbi:hypothetical protein [Pseudarthrobacter sp. fls2-241-R2A-168]|uniref:hypothetical protein n=1 Tax=Pseudarthrobacter sp. fls2-241-R2A-168 TaxID=3040304 RepID=UPI0025533A55|nr:hypothetical protein [Pseudarthrobacter sp. fls2-241-R2A-168]
MVTCSVLRCTNPGSAFTVGSQRLVPGYHEAYVCAEHKALIEAGAPWDMEGNLVLMGMDLAPILANWRARPSVGSEGFTLTLEIAGQIKPVEVFLMPSEARTLSSFIDAANSDGGVCA